jgi:tetratricopeptide (TPR) repeat protein
LSGDEEKQITARYTENAEAYQSYLEGRHHWSRYTRSGIERAIRHFRNAIELDGNYALAYAGIIDCYLRLATNYLPPEGDVPGREDEWGYKPESSGDDADPRVKLRFEWDWKGAERELRRANELQTNYPTAPQWYAAYKRTQQLYDQNPPKQNNNSEFNWKGLLGKPLGTQIPSLELTSSEEIQVYCTIGREQIDAGNYDAASRILRPWWLFGSWPKLDGLNQKSSADLLFTTGELAGFVASTQQIPRGQRHGEELLIASITLFEQLRFRKRAAEGRIELALCYYRQGLFDVGRSILARVLSELSAEDWELRSLALIRLASLERHAGRLKDALTRLHEATDIVELSGPWATSRRHLELASTYKDLALAETVEDAYLFDAKHFYLKALQEFEAVGNHRYVAIVENNIGFLLLNQHAYQQSEYHLLRSSRVFDAFSDVVRGAQVNETLARLYVATEQYFSAQDAIQKAIHVLERTDGEALLAEALTTSGFVESKLGNYTKAKSFLHAGCSVAERCGDYEGVGRALLILLEELGEQLEIPEKIETLEKLKALFATTHQSAMQFRIKKYLESLGSET